MTRLIDADSIRGNFQWGNGAEVGNFARAKFSDNSLVFSMINCEKSVRSLSY